MTRARRLLIGAASWPVLPCRSLIRQEDGMPRIPFDDSAPFRSRQQGFQDVVDIRHAIRAHLDASRAVTRHRIAGVGLGVEHERAGAGGGMGGGQQPGVVGDMLAVEIARGVLEQDRPAPPAVVHDENEFPQRHVVGDMAIGGGTVVPGHVGRQVGVEGGDLAAGGVLFTRGLMVRVPGLVRVLEQARCARAGVGGARRGAERRFDIGYVRRDLDGRGAEAALSAMVHDGGFDFGLGSAQCHANAPA